MNLVMHESAYTWHGDPVRVARAVVTNQLARYAPGAYVRLTGQTGRGEAGTEEPQDIATYFLEGVDDFQQHLSRSAGVSADFLVGKTLIEYGPGDLPGMALLMVARGARKVYCVDRFPLVRLSAKNVRVLEELIDRSQGAERDKLIACLADPKDMARGFDAARIEYLVRPGGLSGLRATADLVVSRAVLEHVNDLPASFDDMVAAMKPGALAAHQVDLRSHGLHKANPLDFLAWSPMLWRLMYSDKGVPNRWRMDRYRDIVRALPVQVLEMAATRRAGADEVQAVRPLLADMFKSLSDDDLAVLGFWLVMRKSDRS